MIEDLQVYLTQNYIEKIHEIIHPVLGVVTSNIAERVGMVALTFRDKETYLGPEHYGLSTNMAPLHINEIGLVKWEVAIHQKITLSLLLVR